jgi:uncharacterized protein YoaH (UPF0181 family)
MGTLREALDQVPDPRSRFGKRHSLGAILALAVCAMLCGAKSLYAISQWGRDQGTPVAQALGFTRHQTPSVATLHRVFRSLDQEAFERVVGQWLQEQGLISGEALAIDGKQLRGIHGEEIPGVRLVAAYAQQSGLVIGQQGVPAGGNELGALPGLWAQLPLAGRVVTGDAQFTQREASREIVAQGGTTSGW